MTRDERQDIIIGICEADGIRMTYTTSGKIVDALDAERCVWTYDIEREWVTSCGNEVLDEATYGQYPFCPCCGKRVEVKDE